MYTCKSDEYREAERISQSHRLPTVWLVIMSLAITLASINSVVFRIYAIYSVHRTVIMFIVSEIITII